MIVRLLREIDELVGELEAEGGHGDRLGFLYGHRRKLHERLGDLPASSAAEAVEVEPEGDDS